MGNAQVVADAVEGVQESLANVAKVSCSGLVQSSSGVGGGVVWAVNRACLTLLRQRSLARFLALVGATSFGADAVEGVQESLADVTKDEAAGFGYVKIMCRVAGEPGKRGKGEAAK
jgi:hypothetical protein